MWQQTKSAVLMSSHSTADEKEPSVSIKVHSETKVKLETYFIKDTLHCCRWIHSIQTYTLLLRVFELEVHSLSNMLRQYGFTSLQLMKQEQVEVVLLD